MAPFHRRDIGSLHAYTHELSHAIEIFQKVALIRNDEDFRRYVALILAQTKSARRGELKPKKLLALADLSPRLKWKPTRNPFGKLYLFGFDSSNNKKARRGFRKLDRLDVYGDIQHAVIALQADGGAEVLASIFDEDARD